MIIFIVGPTAVGKSEIAFSLAQKIKGEIISCDSMQVYKEINIASNKPSLEILQKIPHHLINLISIREEFDVAQYNQLATKAVEEILERGHIPIIVGGSGMYMQILLDGIFKGKEKNEELREKLKCLAKERGISFLYDILKKKDPQAALKIHSNDLRRITRALEVLELNGEPISELKQRRKGLWGNFEIKIFGLIRERAELYQLIEERVEEMFHQDSTVEIERLMDSTWSPTADRIIGVREILGYLRREYDLERAKYLMKLNTRHLVKRQLTWFRKEKRIHWIHLSSDTSLEDVVNIIVKES